MSWHKLYQHLLQFNSNQIPSDQVCVYIVEQDENVTLKQIVELYLKSGENPEDYINKVYPFGGEDWTLWGDVWESNPLPKDALVALAFVESEEECKNNKAYLCNKKSPFNGNGQLNCPLP